MGSLAWTQSSMPGGLMKRGNLAWDKHGRKTVWWCPDRRWPGDCSTAAAHASNVKRSHLALGAARENMPQMTLTQLEYKRIHFWCFRPPSFWYFVKLCWHTHLTMVYQYSDERLRVINNFFSDSLEIEVDE